MIELYEDETLTRVNENIELIQKKQGLTFGTDAYLLYAYMKEQRSSVAVDVGCGTGIISLLCAAKGKYSKIYAVDVQREFCDVARRNAEHNSLDNIVEVVHSDVRELRLEADVVFTNPPYMRSDSGRANISSAKNIARHEIFGGISDFVDSASRILKFGGLFYAVYRPDRLCDLICAMREGGIEPKRMTFVHATSDHEPSMVLVEGKKGAKPSVILTKPLILNDKNGETEDVKYIYERGEFGEQFCKH
ncbi:MAG: methyltransferase domain-containing protein [Ruminococcaceae bacterium]|nr:methyltransferase domain-containing protein [Oscillospiraceae bacterium]